MVSTKETVKSSKRRSLPKGLSAINLHCKALHTSHQRSYLIVQEKVTRMSLLTIKMIKIKIKYQHNVALIQTVITKRLTSSISVMLTHLNHTRNKPSHAYITEMHAVLSWDPAFWWDLSLGRLQSLSFYQTWSLKCSGFLSFPLFHPASLLTHNSKAPTPAFYNVTIRINWIIT